MADAPVLTHYLKTGDLGPAIAGRIIDPRPPYAPQSIQGYGLRIHVAHPDTGALLVDDDAENLDDGTEANRGRWRYQWTAAFAAAADYPGEIQMDIGGRPMTAPNTRNFTVSVFEEVG
jgi:hypothetical protein